MKSFQNTDELEQFLLNHGENIVDLMGGEIDRIEMKLRVLNFNLICICYLTIIKNFFHLYFLQKKFPEIRHCDLEIL